MHALIKELIIIRVENRSEIHSNKPRCLAERTEVVHLRRRLSFVLQQMLSFRTRHHLFRQRVARAGTRQLCSQGLVSIHAHRTEGVAGSEGRERESGSGGGGGIGDGGGTWNGNGDVNGDGDGDGLETETGLGASERRQDENGNGSGDGTRAGTGTGVETRGRTQYGNGDQSGDGNASSSGDGDGIEDGKGNENGEGRGAGGELWYLPHQKISKIEGQALPFRTRHYLCRQELAPAGSQQLQGQDPGPARRCGTEGRTGRHGGREETVTGTGTGVGTGAGRVRG